MIKAVIFDMDGLIIESESIQSKSFEEVLRFYGKNPEFLENGLIHIVGKRGDENWQILKEKYNLEENIQHLREKRREIFEKLLKNNLNPLPGVLPLLKLLKEKHIKIAIASGSTKRFVDIILQGLKIENYFDVIVSGDEVKKGKPNPEAFLIVSQELGISPNECLVLEDSESGVIAAKNAGMKVIAVPTIYTQGHNFSKADKIVQSLKEVGEELLL